MDTQELLVKDTYPAMLSPVGEWVVNGHGMFPIGSQLHLPYED